MKREPPLTGLAHRFDFVAAGLPVRALASACRAWPDLWREHLERQQEPGSPHAATETIFLRAPRELTPAVAFEDLEAVPYPAWDVLRPVVLPVLQPLLRAVRATELGRVLLVRLAPWSSIPAHVDEGAYAEHYDRFHACVEAAQPGNGFTVGGATVEMNEGEAWWFNHKREHRVANSTAAWRTHLLVDAVTPFRARRGTYLQEERVSALWAEALPLLEAHRQEVAAYQDLPLAPDCGAYAQLELAGRLRCYAVRDGGQLLGYAAFFVHPNLHYGGSLQAFQDVLYVVPGRRAALGARLVRFAERRLGALGVQVVHHHAKRVNRFGALLQRLGYAPTDDIFSKRLDTLKES